jgi:hypothetical protein
MYATKEFPVRLTLRLSKRNAVLKVLQQLRRQVAHDGARAEGARTTKQHIALHDSPAIASPPWHVACGSHFPRILTCVQALLVGAQRQRLALGRWNPRVQLAAPMVAEPA